MTNDQWRVEAHTAASALRAAVEDLEFDLGVMSMECVRSTMEVVEARMVTLKEAMEHE